MNELISVIIPFWKVPGIQLRYCINSFLKQSYKNFELILISDGNSLNEYNDLLEEYKLLDSRIKIVYQKKLGVSAARNNGINQAKGVYVVLCDSDDFVESNFLEIMYENILHNDLVICGIAEQFFPVVNSRVDFQYFVSKPSQYNYPQYTNFSVNKIYKKSILDKFNIRFSSSMQMGEDALFVADYIKHCAYIKCLKNSLYHYRWNGFSAMNRYNSIFWLNEQNVIKSQYDLFFTYNLSKEEKVFMTKWLYIKLKDAFYYYLRKADNKDDMRLYVGKIINSEIFSELLRKKEENSCRFSFRDNLIILLWRHCGVSGPFLMMYLSKMKHLILQ
ncbi:glycosyltransferase family 2 protein [Mitsuokella jalaludinii]|uniref:glycosyltransferase family A protein n=1 Tax=Mitsuokella jalaludinii TaxID=187979 RepID=UPI00307E842D